MLKKIFVAAAILLCAALVPAQGDDEAYFNELESSVVKMGCPKLCGMADIANELNTTGTANVIVLLRQPATRKVMTGAAWDSPATMAALHADVAEVEAKVLNNVDAAHVKKSHTYENWAGFAATVTTEGLDALLQNKNVLVIQPDELAEMKTKQGIPLMKAFDVTRGTGGYSKYDGSGMSIAICDTGVDYRHPELGNGGFPNSKVIGGYNIADGKPDPMPETCGHGTACAGIAAGGEVSSPMAGDFIGGVASGARLYALKITPGSSDSTNMSNIYRAWDWCVTHKNDRADAPIMIISTSFGGGAYSDYTDAEDAAGFTAAKSANSAGITVFSASGNDGYCDAVSKPASFSNVVAVGAVYDANIGEVGFNLDADSCLDTPYYETTAADKVCCYSNTASILDIFGPAHNASTTDIIGPDGFSVTGYDKDFGGTSASTPYVAGAGAALQQAAKAKTGAYLSPAALKAYLCNNGDLITDSLKNRSVRKPRVNLARAYAALPSTATGALTVKLLPAAAVGAGARWSIDGGVTWRMSEETVRNITPATYTITYRAISGYVQPRSHGIRVTGGNTANYTMTYGATSAYNMTLTGGDFTAPAAVAPGAMIPVKWATTANYSSTGKFWCEVFGSKTGGFDLYRSGATATGSVYNTNGLGTMENINATVAVNTLPDGLYTLVPIINRGTISGALTETFYTDNWLPISGKRLSIHNPSLSRIDLQLQDVAIETNAHDPTEVTFRGKLRNAGPSDLTKPGCWTEVLYGTLTCEGLLMPQGRLCAGANTQTLANGATAAITQKGKVAGGVAKKAFAFIVDSTDIVPEYNEVNNHGTQIYYEPAILPKSKLNGAVGCDFAIVGMSVDSAYLAPNSLRPGDTFKYKVKIRNKGTVMPPQGKCYLELFASRDGGVSLVGGTTLVASRQIEPPPPTLTMEYTITTTVNPFGDGLYSLTAIYNRDAVSYNPGDMTPLDNVMTYSDGRVYLTNSANGKANLCWSSGPTFTKTGNNTWKVTGTIKNTGTEAATNFWVEAFRGTMQSKTGFFYKDEGVTFAAGVNVSSLAPGSTRNISITGACPPGKVIGAIIDSTDTVPETDETDNYDYSGLTN